MLRAAILVVLVPAGAGLLAVATCFAEAIFDERLPNGAVQQIAELLANAPADVEAGEVTCGKRAHGHSEIVERGIHLLGRGAFFDQKLRFAAVRSKHAV